MAEKEISLTPSAESILSAANNILVELLELPEYKDEERNSGFLFVQETSNQRTHIHHPVGDIESRSTEKTLKYQELSKEKADRVTAYHRCSNVSSYQSRMPLNNKWGGGIWANKYVVGFSGLPELADEALCLVLALAFKWITEEEAQIIANLSSNPYFGPLEKRYKEGMP